jgi:glycine/D-amino acid oxidase-like deaminating enzyme/nitrite reductase/ring-hydroxylating ferredoxin subunit
MRNGSGRTSSVWMRTAEMPGFPRLKEDTHVDVCVVGAGIAGLTTAYLLAREGRSVVVLDDGPVGGGETSRTTAHLSNAFDDRYDAVERMHGAEGARLTARSHTAAIDEIERIVREESIACDFERLDGYLFAPPGSPTDELERELAACHRAGLPEVRRVDRAPLESFETGLCLRFPRQAQFHPLKYLEGLSRAIVREGGRIHTGTHVSGIEGARDGGSARVATGEGRPVVTCGDVVVATNTPVNDVLTMHTKQYPYRTYVIGARVPRGAVTRALYWDTADPYHYVRLQPEGDHDMLIVGGEDHKTGQDDDADERFERLERWSRERFPVMGPVELRWSGQVMEPMDFLAFIGRNPGHEDNVYIATGDSGNGMTHGTIAGMLLRDLILGRENAWAKLYDPGRRTLRAGLTFAQENLNMVAQYAGWVTGGEVKSADEIPPGSGAVVRRGLRKVAVYRDPAGTLHACSATCPHLGAVVGWNSEEQTWDCPAHGSRFDPYGRVVNGPAIGDLAPVEDEPREEKQGSGGAAKRGQKDAGGGAPGARD